MRFANLPPQIVPPNAFRTFATAHLPPHIALPLPPRFAAQVSPTSFPNCALRSALRPRRPLFRVGGADATAEPQRCLPEFRPLFPRRGARAAHGGPRNGRSTATAHNATALRCPSALHFCAAPLRGNARRIRHRPPRIYSTVYSRVAHNGQPAFYGYSLRVPISQSVLISRCDIKGVHTGIFPVYVYPFA